MRILIILLLCSVCLAGSNVLKTVTGGAVKTNDVNQYSTALKGPIFPRASTGVVTSNAGSIGTDDYEWMTLNVASGTWAVGDVKAHHTYNGTVTCGQGWMLADGRVINEANYNTEHGAGSWASHIETSPLSGKYLPAMNSYYAVGASNTSQNGSATLTTVGLSGHLQDFSHQHTNPDHSHIWLQGFTTGGDYTYASDGVTPVLIAPGADAGACLRANATGSSYNTGTDFYTSKYGGSTSSAGSATQDIRPESIAVQFCMRII